jgi:hypothetical protein
MRTVAFWVLIVFGVFYLLTNPDGAAGFVQGLFHGLDSAARSLSSFVSNL